ncbi:MAG: hypothetical protein IPP19_03790 [Verrucomicrobia bacterium]|nr:hypothetical protein [Verrucomicrobiota bacterium]
MTANTSETGRARWASGRNRNCFAALALFCSCAPGVVFAAEDEPTRLDKQIVTATRTRTPDAHRAGDSHADIA